MPAQQQSRRRASSGVIALVFTREEMLLQPEAKPPSIPMEIALPPAGETRNNRHSGRKGNAASGAHPVWQMNSEITKNGKSAGIMLFAQRSSPAAIPAAALPGRIKKSAQQSAATPMDQSRPTEFLHIIRITTK